MTAELESLLKRIRTEYGSLGHRYGGRFLYTPASTFDKNTKMLFVALNPRGDEIRDDFSESVEGGNAFRLEKWGKGQTLNQLQKQVLTFFALLAERLKTTPDVLMDQTMATNFCPFASPSWDELASAHQTVEFCRALWKDILALLQPRVLVTIGLFVEREFRTLLSSQGRLISGTSQPTSWGAIEFSLTHFEVLKQPMLLVGLPHLSHFKIFSERRHGPWITPLVDSITEMIIGSATPKSETSN